MTERVEAATGADLGGVRLHSDQRSAETAEALGARAVTVGQDVMFGSGEYQPGSPDGDRLIAHELVHTVQQSGAEAPQREPLVSSPGDAAEREADQIATSVVSGDLHPTQVQERPSAPVQRAPKGREGGLDPMGSENSQALAAALSEFAASVVALAPGTSQTAAGIASGLLFEVAYYQYLAVSPLPGGWMLPMFAGGASIDRDLDVLLRKDIVELKDPPLQSQVTEALKAALDARFGSKGATAPAKTDNPPARLSNNRIAIFRSRVNLLHSFYQRLSGAGPSLSAEELPVSAGRQQMIGLALTEVGKTSYGSADGDSCQWTDTGPNPNKKARAGWREVKRYFENAGVPPDQRLSDDQLAHTIHGKSWCGIFAASVAHDAGFQLNHWDMIDKSTPTFNQRSKLKTPQPGDVVSNPNTPENHHGIVVSYDGKAKRVETVEGNMNGGQVVHKTRELGFWTTYADVEASAAAATDLAPAQTPPLPPAPNPAAGIPGMEPAGDSGQTASTEGGIPGMEPAGGSSSGGDSSSGNSGGIPGMELV